MRALILVAGAALALAACTDTDRAHWSAYGSEGEVTCFSGGKIVFDDFSTGKIQNPDGSDGFEFKSATTGRLTQVSGQCTVDYGAQPTNTFQAVR